MERTCELSKLLEIASTVGSTLDLPALLTIILEQLQQVVDFTYATLFIIEGSELIVQAYRGPVAEANPGDQRFPVRTKLFCEIINGTPVMVDDVVSGEDNSDESSGATNNRAIVQADTRSWLAVPLLLKDDVLGVLSMEHRSPNMYSQHDLSLARAVATYAAIAIENARLFEQAQTVAALIERRRVARELHDSVVQALYGISLGTRTARAMVMEDAQRTAEALDYVLSAIETSMVRMRALLVEL